MCQWEGTGELRTKIRVLPVDDHPVVLHGLRGICAQDPAIEMVGEVMTGADAIRETSRLEPDVVTLPIRLGGTRSGIELSRAIHSVGPSRVVVFTSFTRPVDVQVAALAGASALVSKSAHPDVFLKAIHQVFGGERPLASKAVRADAVPGAELLDQQKLSSREQEILGLVLEGLTNVAIGQRLMIEMSTVKTHMRSILRKLGVGSRRDLL